MHIEANHCTCLGLKLLIGKMGVLMPTFWGHCEKKNEIMHIKYPVQYGTEQILKKDSSLEHNVWNNWAQSQ